MLSSFNKFVEGIENETNGKKRTGADALEVTCGMITKELINTQDFERSYQKAFKKCKNDLGPYFRQIYNILKFLSRQRNINSDQKKFYSNILRSQLSSAELSLLMFNCATSYGIKKMNPLVKEFDLLKHCDDLNFQKMGGHLKATYKDWKFMKDHLDYATKP